MDNESFVQFLTTKATVDDNRHPYDDKMKTYDSKLDKLKEIIKNMMDQNQNSNSSPDKMD